MNKALQPSNAPHSEFERLQQQFADARYELLQTEERLAQEQAAVNAFRMHCRLKIGILAEQAADLRTQKQRLLTRLQLLRQAEELGIPYNESEPFWQGEPDEEAVYLDDLPMPTDTPRDKIAEKRLYRQLAQRFHPDLAAGSGEKAYRTALMASINSAYTGGDIASLRDFAEEMDPALFLELGLHESSEVRRLRKQINACRRRKRRLLQELKALHEENTARLWRRARQLEEEGRNWWDEVREELKEEIAGNQQAIAHLQSELARLDPVF